MPRSDLLLSLVQAGAKGDQPNFRRALEAIVADERGRQHHLLADQLAAFLAPTQQVTSVPCELVDEVTPRRKLADLVLPEAVRHICVELIEEQGNGQEIQTFPLIQAIQSNGRIAN